jgi:hypothetical protein
MQVAAMAQERLASVLVPGTLRRRIVLALGVYVACTIVFFACAQRQLLTEHTQYNHYALLADAWLHGRLDLGHPPPAYSQNNDFAEYQGRYYVSFPPFPAVLLLPLVKLAGSPENLRDGQFWLWFAGAGPALLFLVLEKLRRLGESQHSEIENLALSWIFAFGTVYFFSAEQGTVWFAAHVVAVALVAIFLLASLDADSPWLAGTAIALAFVTRPDIAPAGIFFVLQVAKKAKKDGLKTIDWRFAARKLVPFAVPVFVVCAVTAWHNHARFGTLEFGHEHLTVGWRARIDKWGLFSYHYLARNLGIVTSSLPYYNKAAPKFQVNSHGLALWFTTPIYLMLLWPKRKSFVWKSLAISVAPVFLALLMYQNSGWLQFGYRFSNDFAILLFAMLATGGYRFGAVFYSLAAWGIAVNAFGALTFGRAGLERFYYTDSSQQTIFQPD